MHRRRFILPTLRSRALRLTVLAFQALWLNVIVPGHTRGVVQLPGSDCAACRVTPHTPALRPCCHAKQDKPHHGKPVPAPVDPVSHCAICHFAALLSPAVAVDSTHPALALISGAHEQSARIVRPIPFTATYLGRAPPVSC